MSIGEYRRRLSEEEEQKCGNAKFVSKTELLQQSDYISLHLPASSESFHFLDSAEFTMMKNVCCGFLLLCSFIISVMILCTRASSDKL